MQKNAGFGIIKSIKLPHLSAFCFPSSGFKYIFVFPSVPVIIRKYGSSVTEIFEYRQKIQNRLDEILNRDEKACNRNSCAC